MSVTSESALTCANCGRVALWRSIDEPFPGMHFVPVQEFDNYFWWLEIPCIHCGSQKFNVRVDNPRSHCVLHGISV